jgi:predicted nucleic acid-binding protein
VDASAFAAVTFLEADYSATQKDLAGAELHAPALLYFEMANVCVKKLRASPANRDMVLSQYGSFLSVTTAIHDVDPVAIVKLAEDAHLSVYDASYLWLAQTLGVALVTLDHDLAKASAKIGLPP